MVINTVINLDGRWQVMIPNNKNDTRRAKVSVSSSSITIDMSQYGFTAFGMILDEHTITVTFSSPASTPETLTGKLEKPDIIRWSNPRVPIWKKDIKSEINSDVARKLESGGGFWNSTGEGTPRAKISVSSSSITIDMSDFGRPTAHGSILDASTITVNFPDDRSYTGKLDQPRKINWSNGTVWNWVFVEG